MTSKEEILSAFAKYQDKPLVRKAIGLIDFEESPGSPIKAGACFVKAGIRAGDSIPKKAKVVLFKNSAREDGIRAFAEALESVMDDDRKDRVKWFLTTVNPDWVGLIKLNWPDLTNFPTYQSLIDHHTNPVSRLCTIILCNAFVANKVPRRDSTGSDLMESPYAKEWLAGEKYYALYSLVTAYAPQFDNFKEFFLEGCDDFSNVLSTELQMELTRFLESVLS